MKAIDRKTGDRPGLAPEYRAVWEVAHHPEDEDGNPRTELEIVQQLETRVYTSASTVGMTAFARIRRDSELPDAYLIPARCDVIGYVNRDKIGNDGLSERVHGLRCALCGSREIEVRSRAWAVCGGCDSGQDAAVAQLCADHCTECLEQGT